MAISASWDGSVRVWDVATGECVRTLQQQMQVQPQQPQMQAQQASQRFARHETVGCGSCRASIIAPVACFQLKRPHCGVINEATTESIDIPFNVVGHTKAVTSAGFSPDGRKMVSSDYDGAVRVWDVATGECEQTLQGHTEVVFSAVFSPDGTKVISASRDTTVRVWRIVR